MSHLYPSRRITRAKFYRRPWPAVGQTNAIRAPSKSSNGTPTSSRSGSWQCQLQMSTSSGSLSLLLLPSTIPGGAGGTNPDLRAWHPAGGTPQPSYCPISMLDSTKLAESSIAGRSQQSVRPMRFELRRNVVMVLLLATSRSGSWQCRLQNLNRVWFVIFASATRHYPRCGWVANPPLNL